MEANMKYTVVLLKDEDDPQIFNAVVPAIPGCVSWGKGKDEAIKNAIEAIECCLESMAKQGEHVPEEIEARQVEVA
jgi:antitoxin HicB